MCIRDRSYQSDKRPRKKVAVLTCMDTRLTALLPAALGLKGGDVKMIKNAGGLILNPLDSTVRSPVYYTHLIDPVHDIRI